MTSPSEKERERAEERAAKLVAECGHLERTSVSRVAAEIRAAEAEALREAAQAVEILSSQYGDLVERKNAVSVITALAARRERGE